VLVEPKMLLSVMAPRIHRQRRSAATGPRARDDVRDRYNHRGGRHDFCDGE
jgi:hypothetical protein